MTDEELKQAANQAFQTIIDNYAETLANTEVEELDNE